ncbi:MAG: PIG-L family deacetylase [Burkholderiales bacterium]|nr:PIG-L family deacetylase [Burkholderiales bacterium]
MEPLALFFFAHQDDEFGVFEHIVRARASGQRVCCAYLTSGVAEQNSPTRRNSESTRVLLQLGVAPADIHFPGQELGIADAHLVRHIERAVDWIATWLAGLSSVASAYLPAWEGGHHDHDALHAAVLLAARRTTSGARLRQFPLYNAYHCPSPFFRVFKPLPVNGPAEHLPIPWRRRLRFLRYCLSYPSQAKSWAGLLPFTILHYVLRGIESEQDVSLQRLRERPHPGPLYYERRGFCTWPEVQQAVWACVQHELPVGAA